MPELPEVETVVRELDDQGVAGRRILQARAFWKPMIAPLSPYQFARRLRNRRILSIRRRAKFIVMELSGRQFLLIHLRMSGHLAFYPARTQRKRHEHVTLRLDGGRVLRYRDPRKFGRWILTDDPGHVLDRLGPEPFSGDFAVKTLSERLKDCRRQLKPLLLDQSFVAGIGNIYADEALWEARLHPCRRSDTLTATEARRLHAAIRLVLRRGLRHSGTSLGQGLANYRRPGGQRGRNQDGLRVFRKTGQPCPRCGTRIERMKIVQRSSHICRKCQREKPAGG